MATKRTTTTWGKDVHAFIEHEADLAGETFAEFERTAALCRAVFQAAARQPELMQAWLAGYKEVRSFGEKFVQLVETMPRTVGRHDAGSD